VKFIYGRSVRTTDILTAIVAGIVVGVLGRLVLPGRQAIGSFVTVLIGIGAAILGTLLAKHFGVEQRAMVDLHGVRWSWAVLGIQVGIAVVGVAFAQALTHTILAENDDRPRPRRRRSRSR
jgi:uncharacterized membrane protein YeaQ/YmgE (transglycosylase-associated protein family)